MIWQKQCRCRAPATTGTPRIWSERDPETGGLRVRAEVVQGPSCDRCGAAWAPVEEGEATVPPPRPPSNLTPYQRIILRRLDTVDSATLTWLHRGVVREYPKARVLDVHRALQGLLDRRLVAMRSDFCFERVEEAAPPLVVREHPKASVRDIWPVEGG